MLECMVDCRWNASLFALDGGSLNSIFVSSRRILRCSLNWARRCDYARVE